MIDCLLLFSSSSDSLVPHPEPRRIDLEHLRPFLFIDPNDSDHHTQRSHPNPLGRQLTCLRMLLHKHMHRNSVPVLKLEFSRFHSQSGNYRLRIYHVSSHNRAYLVRDIENMCH